MGVPAPPPPHRVTARLGVRARVRGTTLGSISSDESLATSAAKTGAMAPAAATGFVPLNRSNFISTPLPRLWASPSRDFGKTSSRRPSLTRPGLSGSWPGREAYGSAARPFRANRRWADQMPVSHRPFPGLSVGRNRHLHRRALTGVLIFRQVQHHELQAGKGAHKCVPKDGGR